MSYDTDPPDSDVESARLGIEAEAFLRSTLGRHMMTRVEEDVSKYTGLLISADPEDSKKNRELRNKIHVAQMVEQWILEVIHSGAVSAGNLVERDAIDT